MSTSSQGSQCCPCRNLLDRMSLISLGDCVALKLPADTPIEDCQAFAKALESAAARRPLLIIGDIQELDEAAMNAAGWYRK